MSCTSKEETLKNKRDEVMQIHDEAMAKMDALNNYETIAREKVFDYKSNMQDDSASFYETILFETVDAQNNMMDWMHQYNLDSASNNNSKAEEYLKSQLTKVKKVHQDIFNALENGKKHLK